jgi:hypothetical protein
MHSSPRHQTEVTGRLHAPVALSPCKEPAVTTSQGGPTAGRESVKKSLLTLANIEQ